MKTISYGKPLVLAALLGIFLFSCSKDDEIQGTQMTTIYITANLAEVDTKTVLDGRKAIWEEGDQVAALTYNTETGFFKIEKELAPVSFEGSTASFAINAVKNTKVLYLVYPSSAVESYDAVAGRFVMNSESIQTGNTGSFGSGSSFSIAKINENNQALFRNLMGLVKVEITSDDVISLALSGNKEEALCGAYSVDPETLDVSIVSGSSKLSLLPEDETFFPGVYYIPVFPSSVQEGFKVSLINQEGLLASKKYTQNHTFNRNKITNLGKESDWGVTYINAIKTVTVQFSNGTTGTWPFTQTIPKAAGTLMGPYTTETDSETKFFFTLANYASTNCRVTAGGGFRYGGTAGDYILLPGLEGYKMISISITGSKNNASIFSVMTHPQGDELSSIVVGGEQKTIGKAYDTKQFDLSETLPGTPYRLTLPANSPVSFNAFTITYEIY